LKAIKIFIPVVIAVILLQGCKKQVGSEFLKAQKMLGGLETYTVTAEIIVRGNKVVENYVVKQYFKYPDRYRLEVVSPGDKCGKVTIYDGQRIVIYHPQIKQVYIMENFKEVEETGMFPGHFAKNLFSSENADYQVKKIGSDEYTVIKVEIPGGNNYRKYQVLYIDNKSTVPYKMEILDSNGNTAVTVHYKNFLYNNKIDDKLFTMDIIPTQGVEIVK
jgi:outer membrane lipoprotein-sorting protein